eukprot:477088_1
MPRISCIISIGEKSSGQAMNNMRIYAVESFNDVKIICEANTCYGDTVKPTLYCTSNFGTSCKIQRLSGFSDWGCIDGAENLCNHYTLDPTQFSSPPTSLPTSLPHSLPTNNPTFIPTNNPTTVTNYPSTNSPTYPSNTPSLLISPSQNPTTSPTKFPTATPTVTSTLTASPDIPTSTPNIKSMPPSFHPTVFSTKNHSIPTQAPIQATTNNSIANSFSTDESKEFVSTVKSTPNHNDNYQLLQILFIIIA